MSSFIEVALSLLPFAVLLTVVWSLLRPTFFRRLVAGIREKKIYQKERTLAKGEPPPNFVLPYVIVIWCLFIIIGLILGPPEFNGSLEEGVKIARHYRPYRDLAVPVLLIAAVVIHLRPNHSRELKYTLILSLVPAIGLFGTGAVIREQTNVLSISIELIIMLVFLIISHWYFLFLIILSYWVRTGYITRLTRRKVGLYIFGFLRRRWFGPSVLLLLMLNPDVAIFLLIGRYVFVEAFRHHPIVYLRSFRYEGAAMIFGRAIAPALAPFGVIRALVHGSQTGRNLLYRTSIWQFGLLATVSDALWQNWVSDAIRRGSLAVIDCTVWTESVDWEIQTSLRELGPSRVLVITVDQSLVVAAHGALIISYSTNRGGIDRLRVEVTSWASEALNIDARKAQRFGTFVWLVVLILIVGRFVLLTLLISGQTAT